MSTALNEERVLNGDRTTGEIYRWCAQCRAMLAAESYHFDRPEIAGGRGGCYRIKNGNQYGFSFSCLDRKPSLISKR